MCAMPGTLIQGALPELWEGPRFGADGPRQFPASAAGALCFSVS